MATAKAKPRGKASAPKDNSKTLTVEEEYALNCEVAQHIKTEAKKGSQKWRMGQWVALSKGQVITVGKTLEEVSVALSRVEPDRFRGMVFEVRDPDEVLRK